MTAQKEEVKDLFLRNLQAKVEERLKLLEIKVKWNSKEEETLHEKYCSQQRLI